MRGRNMDFKEKIKKVRIEIGYSQEQLARELGVSFATINRWENGKSEPRQIALNTFEHFCMLHNVKIEEE
ncbi:XRE family transcriptional regulator [[Clostridium] symbiosum]|nr:XRE family transcriptional regulator [[Clostridium] symbiosum]